MVNGKDLVEVVVVLSNSGHGAAQAIVLQQIDITVTAHLTRKELTALRLY